MTDALANFHFIRPAWLLLAPLAIGLWWLWLKSSEPLRGWRSQISPVLLKALTIGGHSAQGAFARWLLVGWLLAIVAIAGPTWRQEPSPFAEDSPPLMILLKADQTMAPANQQPTSLARAKLKIADLAEKRKGQPLGLIAYAGSAHLVLPPTQDTSVVSQMAAEISPEIMPAAGDRMDLAIQAAQQIMASEQTSGSFLVIADSVNADAAQLAAAQKSLAGNSLQFLAIANNDPSKLQSIRNAAKMLNASVMELSADDTDIAAIVRNSERASYASVTGKETHWQEAGYWLVPWIALLMAFSFRRESAQAGGGAA
ncbi:VWA domain-containing protein [Blastopirellula sp. J2-11]|uniref:VWA domain-containing protein n=1 Tax=Blastopirellula sp. J2-11 TaxID=2943192 RepID=UPI0021C9C70C|nr:VWA domain-containing protein [Blastopirellula sp. J2-11]UUO07188.1 VWA domain-containing protein [Blastopirellula sp. J2-11]